MSCLGFLIVCFRLAQANKLMKRVWFFLDEKDSGNWKDIRPEYADKVNKMRTTKNKIVTSL